MSAMNGLKKTSGWLNHVLWSFAACLLTLSPIAHGIETVTYYHLDALGSTVAATDDGGNVLWREAYKPYGERLNGQDEAGWYTGKAYDEDIGLNYFGARWYHPELGRFMADDPVGFDESNPQSFNRYAYANNNPYRYVDPDGRFAETAFDVVSLGLSIRAYKADPSFSNGAAVVYDAFATVVPFLPGGLGIIKTTGNITDGIGGVKKGLTTPEKYFGSKTKQEAKDALENKYGPPKSSREHADTYYNERTKRSYNVHEQAGHNEGKPHVDIRRRGGHKERKYNLKEGNQ